MMTKTSDDDYGAPEFIPGFSGVHVTRSLVLSVMYCVLSFCTFSFGHCVVCPSSMCRF